ncbi:MAG TPA: acetyl-CoA C-acyltransferase [Chloroflexota bacterium]|nr:acetyl-CoA C-acyltransferase [Chloroflexota bacterium]
MRQVVLASGVRTPFGAFGGALKDFWLPELGGVVIREAIQKAGVAPDEVDEVDMGINLPGSDRSIARQSMLKAGIPETKNANSVDRACCSSMAAITMARRGIQAGDVNIAVAGGTENMSKVPYFVHDMRWGHRLGDIQLKDQLVIADPMTGKPRAVQAADEAEEFGIGREEQDAWALRSQELWKAAWEAGRFADEIVPIEVPQGKSPPICFDRDESPRDTTLEKLAKLPTVYGSKTVTPGNAPGLNTGASAVVLMGQDVAEQRGCQPLASIVGWSQVSGHPDKLASIPAVAAKKALAEAGLSIDDIDLIEINEAFAAMPLVSTKLLAGGDAARMEAIRAKTNVNGGAIALGHPTGATAARLVLTVAHELQRRGGGLGLATLCGGIGEGECVIVRVS